MKILYRTIRVSKDLLGKGVTVECKLKSRNKSFSYDHDKMVETMKENGYLNNDSWNVEGCWSCSVLTTRLELMLELTAKKSSKRVLSIYTRISHHDAREAAREVVEFLREYPEVIKRTDGMGENGNTVTEITSVYYGGEANDRINLETD